MKKLFTITLFLALPLSPLAAQQSAAQLPAPNVPGPWDPGIYAGMITDLIGYALFVSGGAIATIDFSTSVALSDVGSLGMTIGGLVWSIFLDQKNAAYADAGISIPTDKRSLSWTLVWVSAGCTAGSVVVALADESFTGGLISFILVAAAAVVETINATGPRQKWAAALNEGYRAQNSSLSGPAVFPEVALLKESDTKQLDLYLGMKLSL